MSAPSAGRSGYRAALRHRDFRLLATGTIVDHVGSWAYTVALAVYVYSATHSAAWIGAASAARFIPALLFGRYAAMIAGRFERTKVIVVANVVCAVLMIGLSVTSTYDGPVVIALVFAALSSTAVSVLAPATSALVPDLVGETDLVAANALTRTLDNVAVAVGPAIGAALLAHGDPSIVFLLNAATFFFSAEMVLRIQTRSRPVEVAPGGRAGPPRQLRVGLGQIGSSSAAALLVGYGVLAGALYGADTVLLVVVSQAQLGTGAVGLGYLLAGLGAGGVIATAFVDRLASSPRLASIITVGMAGYSLPTAALVWVHVPAVAFGLQVIRGAGALLVAALTVTALQRSVPSDVSARVFRVFWAPLLAGISVGALITPPLLSAFGRHAVLLGYGLGATAGALAAYPRLRRLDEAALARTRRLGPRIALLDGLGIFAAASRPVLERLAGAATRFAVIPGFVIVRAGEPADALYVLEVGEVALNGGGEAGSSSRSETLSAPGYFGDIGLIERSPRADSVTAVEKCALLRIDGQDLLDAVTRSPASTALVEGARAR